MWCSLPWLPTRFAPDDTCDAGRRRPAAPRHPGPAGSLHSFWSALQAVPERPYSLRGNGFRPSARRSGHGAVLTRTVLGRHHGTTSSSGVPQSTNPPLEGPMNSDHDRHGPRPHHRARPGGGRRTACADRGLRRSGLPEPGAALPDGPRARHRPGAAPPAVPVARDVRTGSLAREPHAMSVYEAQDAVPSGPLPAVLPVPRGPVRAARCRGAEPRTDPAAAAAVGPAGRLVLEGPARRRARADVHRQHPRH